MDSPILPLFFKSIPKWSGEIATDLVPVWNDFAGITKGVKSIVKELGHDFTYMVGVLSGDKSLQTQTTNMQQFGTAIGDTVRWIAEFTHATLIASKAAIGFTEILVEGIHNKKMPDFTQHVGKDGKTSFDLWHNGVASDNYFTQAFQEAKEDSHPGGLDYNRKKDSTAAEPKSSQGAATTGTAATAARLAQKVSADTGLPADLIFAQWEFETGKFTNSQTKNLNNMGGIKVPGTNVFKKFESLDQYADAFEKIITSSRYVNNGIRDAKTPEEWARALKTPSGTYYGTDSEKDYAAGIRKYQPDIRDYQASGAKAAGDVVINGLTITVPSGTTNPDDIKRIVSDAIVDAATKNNQRVMAQTAAGAYH